MFVGRVNQFERARLVHRQEPVDVGRHRRVVPGVGRHHGQERRDDRVRIDGRGSTEASARYAGASVGDNAGGSQLAPGSISTRTRASPITFDTCASTAALVSPGSSRTLTVAIADVASTLALSPARSIVGAIVVRTRALVCGCAASCRISTGRVSQRFANAVRMPQVISGVSVLNVSARAPSRRGGIGDRSSRSTARDRMPTALSDGRHRGVAAGGLDLERDRRDALLADPHERHWLRHADHLVVDDAAFVEEPGIADAAFGEQGGDGGRAAAIRAVFFVVAEARGRSCASA